MKLYTISGLGADEKVLEKLTFNESVEVVHIPWLIPNPEEDFADYVQRMSAYIDDSEEFYLLGYSLGGIVAQEIHKLKPAKKIVIMASIRSDREKSKLIRAGQRTNAVKYIPLRIFNDKAPFFTPFSVKFLFYFIFQALAAYFNLYFLIPKYLEKNRLLVYMTFLLLTIIAASLCIIPGYYLSAY
ncbi:MAG: alpha/beta hydrolase, partial [Chryseobacterium sp.]